ncbi:hypothetical protein BDW22DRAFT_1428244 [Trametopsis cervina]|nr:hypothetical protein BDW22DRAFT_1428244 [Trametopsis cervina]
MSWQWNMGSGLLNTIHNNKMTILLSQVATSHAGLVLAHLCGLPLPFDTFRVGAISASLLLLLWSDTTSDDAASRLARSKLRNSAVLFLSFSYLLVFLYFAAFSTRPLASLVMCMWYLTNSGTSGEHLAVFHRWLSLMRGFISKFGSSPAQSNFAEYEDLKESNRPRPV